MTLDGRGSLPLQQEPGGAGGSFNVRVQGDCFIQKKLGQQRGGGRLTARIKASSFSIFSVCLFSDPALRSGMEAFAVAAIYPDV